LFWKPFINNLFPKDNEFLIKLPQLLSELTALRRPSAHGKMSEPEKAEKAREIVKGTNEHPGLLEKLVGLKCRDD
jgi:hypothetical protein